MSKHTVAMFYIQLFFLCIMDVVTMGDPMIQSSYAGVGGRRQHITQQHHKHRDGKEHIQQDANKKARDQKTENIRKLNGGQWKGGTVYRRMHANATPVDYGGDHPYEIMERERRRLMRVGEQKRRKATAQHYKNYWFESSFSVDDYIQDDWYEKDDDFDINQHDPETFFEGYECNQFNFDKFRPIRIKVDTAFLDEQRKDSNKNEFIIYHVLPAAIQFWTKALKVFPAKRLFVYEEYCSLASFTDYGRTDADLVLFLSADMSCSGEDGSGFETIAGATSCAYDQYDRPIGGRIDFCYNTFKLNQHGKASNQDLEKMIDVAIHEIGHVLGLTSDDMAFYHDQKTGMPRTPRPVDPVTDFTCVTGKKSSEFDHEIYVPSQNTLKFGATYPGIRYFEVVTPTVRKVAQSHFNCDKLKGMRLENQPTSDDCFGDHWEERLTFDGKMSSVLTPEPIPSHLSPFTLALLEDTGWYQANFSMSRVTSFGHGIGCDFVEQPCIRNDTVPDYAEGFFCNSTDKNNYACDPSHHMIATCDMYDLSKLPDQNYPPIPQVFRQFNHPAMGPRKLQQADFCPIYSEAVISCLSDPHAASSRDHVILEEHFGPQSRCFNSNNARPLCLKSSCDEELGVIWVHVGQNSVKCEHDGQVLDIEVLGKLVQIECPKKAVLCPDMFCPHDCGGQGICNWNLTKPQCQASDIVGFSRGLEDCNGYSEEEKNELVPNINEETEVLETTEQEGLKDEGVPTSSGTKIKIFHLVVVSLIILQKM